MKKVNSFNAFLLTQFLGVFNDNVFKMMVSWMIINQYSEQIEKKTFYLSLATAISIIPFVLFAGYAGFLTDRFNKTKVLQYSKSAEILAMALALLLYATTTDINLFILALCLMGAQSTFFSPGKYSIIPEIVPQSRITQANGKLTMLTYLAIILGSAAGGLIYDFSKDTPIYMGVFVFTIAILGVLSALMIPDSPHNGNPEKKFHPNPLHMVIKAIPIIRANRSLKFAVIGSFLFWALTGFLYFCLLLLGEDVLEVTETQSSLLFSFVGLGIALGGIVAGFKAGERSRLYLCPLGATIVALGCMSVWFVQNSYSTASIIMFVIGVGCGIYIVPVVTTLQKASPAGERGQIIATSSFFDIGGVVVAAVLNHVIHGEMRISPNTSAALVGTGILIIIILSRVIYPRFYNHSFRTFGS